MKNVRRSLVGFLICGLGACKSPPPRLKVESLNTCIYSSERKQFECADDKADWTMPFFEGDGLICHPVDDYERLVRECLRAR